MRYREIIEADTWEARHREFQRNRAKRAKLAVKLRNAEAKAYRQKRQAADQQASNNDKLADIKRDLADKPKAD